MLALRQLVKIRTGDDRPRCVVGEPVDPNDNRVPRFLPLELGVGAASDGILKEALLDGARGAPEGVHFFNERPGIPLDRVRQVFDIVATTERVHRVGDS